ncbi:uncharacterized protein LOC141621862 isoform X2 [Silene latifolia]|uniref:uncharacterized protein LOC141621862 isoform X2 n=1 Tax=Silene latifolia TaxID=37657 RepID=UPI003D7726B0
MSYRSKRTRALMTEDDESQVVKKLTSNVPVSSTTLTANVMSGADDHGRGGHELSKSTGNAGNAAGRTACADVRWGPFKPPTGKPQIGSDKCLRNCMHEATLKSRMLMVSDSSDGQVAPE